MIIGIAWIVGAVVAIVAAALACADSAIMANYAATNAAMNVVPDAARRADRERAHRSVAMARVLAYIAAGACFAQPLARAFPGTPARVVATALLVLLVAWLTEGVGRSLGYAHPDASLRALHPLIALIRVLLSPAVALGTAIEHAINAVIPAREVDAEQREISAEQFMDVVTAEAEVSAPEEALIHGVFSLGTTEVHEIMVPRVDMVGLDREMPWSEMLDRVRSSEHARFPVFDETLDNVSGILYAKDLLPAVIADAEPDAGWQSFARPAVFIPTSKRIDAQLREFQASRTHIAIVSDEYGGTAGLVTIEDIIEEIVGEIHDEYDVDEPEIKQEGADRFWAAGRLPVADLEERLDTEFRAEDAATVGGLVYTLLGRVPRSGEALERNGFRIVVERVRRRRIERVYFERLHTDQGEAAS
jgi:CBS domain containing-hemolysin-like protein